MKAFCNTFFSHAFFFEVYIPNSRSREEMMSPQSHAWTSERPSKLKTAKYCYKEYFSIILSMFIMELVMGIIFFSISPRDLVGTRGEIYFRFCWVLAQSIHVSHTFKQLCQQSLKILSDYLHFGCRFIEE